MDHLNLDSTMVWKPDDNITFGKHKGYKLSEIYKFCPDYLEWAIEYLEDFLIDVASFEALPKPTPFKKRYPITLNGKSYENMAIKPKDSDIPHAYEHLKNNIVKEADYKFPERIKLIVKEKIEGSYEVPPYELLGKQALSAEEFLNKYIVNADDLICWICKGNKKTGCLKGLTTCNKFEWVDRK